MIEFEVPNRGSIANVADLATLIDSDVFARFRETSGPVSYNEPFGIWFRGEGVHCKPLTPSVFRTVRNEPSLTYHFMLRAAASAHHCTNTFDWLCLMRHYELPTRLLDWTESVIVGLYFAVTSPRDSGSLFVLNAHRLNQLTMRWPTLQRGIAIPWSLETALRAEFSRARSQRDYIDQISSLGREHIEDGLTREFLMTQIRSQPSTILPVLSSPVAVFPNRFNTRMIMQQSTFTLHGGVADGAGRLYESVTVGSEPLPPARGLCEMSQGLEPDVDFLLRAKVTNASGIRKQLAYMGVHEGSLFPELDKQARYVEKTWEPRL